jgi:hypothetical protein
LPGTRPKRQRDIVGRQSKRGVLGDSSRAL